MYIIQNAFQNVLRNRGRNILVGVIIFAIITTSVVALIINNTASGIIDDYRGRFGSEVTIQPDRSQMQGMRYSGSSGGAPSVNTGSGPVQITPQQYLSFAESEYLLDTVFTSSQMVGTDEHTSELTAYGEDEDDGGMAGGAVRMYGSGENWIQPSFRMLGDEWKDFDDGMRFIADGDGRMPEADDECVISVELAALNNLSVGDVITLGGSGGVTADGEEVPNNYYTLTVVGVYNDLTDESASGGGMVMMGGGGIRIPPAMNRRNEILVTFDTIANHSRGGVMGASVSAVYYLKDPSMLDAFAAECYAKGLDETWLVSTDQDGYDTVVKPVVGMKGITFTFLVIVLILGAIILVLLTSIAVRERKYEIGVLRAMGMKRGKVALGLWSELLMITCVCVILGLLAGVIAAQPVSDALLTGQLESINNAANSNRGGPQMVAMRIGAPIGQQYSALDTLDVSLGADTLLQIIAIALILATVAALAAISRITQYEPIKILMERN